MVAKRGGGVALPFFAVAGGGTELQQMDVEVAHRSGALPEPAEIRSQPAGDTLRQHAPHLPEQRPCLAGRDPEIVQALGVEVGLDAGRVHFQHRIEDCEQTLARCIRAFAGIEVRTGRNLHGSEFRIRPVGSREHGLAVVGRNPLHDPEPANRTLGETFVTPQWTDREPGRTAARGETFDHEHGLVLAVAAPGNDEPTPGLRDHEQPPDVDQGREQRAQASVQDIARERGQGRAGCIDESRDAAEPPVAQQRLTGKRHVLQHEAGMAQSSVERIEIAHMHGLPRVCRSREFPGHGRHDSPHRETARHRECTGFEVRSVVRSSAHRRVIYRYRSHGTWSRLPY